MSEPPTSEPSMSEPSMSEPSMAEPSTSEPLTPEPSMPDRSMAEARVWSRRFLALVADLGMTEPLRAGRHLARAGAVVSLRRSGNLVVALVRDGDERVHKSRIAFGRLAGGDWSRIERALGARAGYAASLLLGTIPADIDAVVADLGLSLLPTGDDDLVMDCSCDDWQRPCAHAAAACHELARHLELDPFEVLALRGRERDVLLDGVRTYWAAPITPSGPGPDGADGADAGVVGARPGGSPPDEELPADAQEFWAAALPTAPGAGTRAPGTPVPGEAGSLLDEYGPLVVGSSDDLRDRLRPAYQRFADGSQ